MASRRALTPDDERLVREMHREYLRLADQRGQIDRQILDLLDQRAEVTQQMARCSQQALAEKFGVSHPVIIYTLRSRAANVAIRH